MINLKFKRNVIKQKERRFVSINLLSRRIRGKIKQELDGILQGRSYRVDLNKTLEERIAYIDECERQIRRERRHRRLARKQLEVNKTKD